MNCHKKTLIAALMALAVSSAHAELFDAWVSSIENADTVKIILRNEQWRTLRIAGIDAPDPGQDYSEQAKKALSNMVLNKVVLVRTQDDAQGSLPAAAQIAVSGQDVGLAMIEGGYAWLNRSDEHVLSSEWFFAYESAQDKAMRTLSGMWSRGPVPPWVWRKFYGKSEKGMADESPKPSEEAMPSEKGEEKSPSEGFAKWLRTLISSMLS